MLRHFGQHRTHRHNLRLAALLCLAAGMVNVAGFLGFMVLTTNVTGHAALFAGHIARGELRDAAAVAWWMLLFLGGAFFSSLVIGTAGRDRRYAYSIPMVLEMLILAAVGFFGRRYNHSLAETRYFAGGLLFAMGMQNALVTMISGSVVRTTHLTGMFTDLGIELSAVLYGDVKVRKRLRPRLVLHLAIIFFFMAGGVVGGYLFSLLQYHTFYIAAVLLLVAQFYDVFRVKTKKAVHNWTHRATRAGKSA